MKEFSKFIIIIVISSLGYEKVTSSCNFNTTEATCDTIEVPSDILSSQSITYLEIVNGFQGTSLPQYLFRYSNFDNINIRNCEIKIIRENTFVDLSRVQYLGLENNRIENIQPGAFKNLTFLTYLTLNYNKIKLLQAGVFTKLPISKLSLSYNSIVTIEESALSDLPNLWTLDLNNNNIENILISKIIDDPSKLMYLDLRNNSLTILTNDMLKGLTNLRRLFLRQNKIKTIEEGTFQQTPELQILQLTYNRIKEINGSIFPRRGLSNLRQVHLAKNELMYLTSDFFFRLNNLDEIALVGNPWLCPCLDVISRILYDNKIKEICQGPFKNAGGPICISDRIESKCSFKYNSELSSSYLQIANSVEYKETHCDLFVH